ncbi:MAG: hypothetical protein U1E65_17230 [Myxococcota bacterium]
MTCALGPTLLAKDPAAFELHAGTCLDCARLAREKERVYALLKTPPLELNPMKKAALWGAIEAASAAPARRPSVWAFGAFAAAAALGLGLWMFGLGSTKPPVEATSPVAIVGGSGPDREVVAGAWVKADPGQTIQVAGRGALRAKAETMIALETFDGALGLRVAKGELEVELLGPTARLVVRTPTAQLELLGAKASLSVSAVETRGVVHTGDAIVKRGAGTIEHVGASGMIVAAASLEEPPPSASLSAMAPAAAPSPTPSPTPRKHHASPPPFESPLRSRPAPSLSAPDPTPPIAPVTPPPRPPRAALEEARALLGHDDRRASELAAEVYHRDEEGPEAGFALCVAADGYRRSGQKEIAVQTYEKAMRFPGSADEASYRRATLLHELGDDDRALEQLSAVRTKLARASLAPERIRLEAEILLKRGRPEAAASAIESGGNAAEDLKLDGHRLAIARALSASAPARARALVEFIVARRARGTAIWTEADAFLKTRANP